MIDIDQLNSPVAPVGSLIVSAALIDDVLSLLLLAVLTGVIESGVLPGAGELGRLFLKIALFFASTAGIGVAMSARGAVELIIADIALRAGLFSKPDPTPPEVASLFSAIVIMAVVTTVATPIVLRRIYASDSKQNRTDE